MPQKNIKCFLAQTKTLPYKIVWVPHKYKTKALCLKAIVAQDNIMKDKDIDNITRKT